MIVGLQMRQMIQKTVEDGNHNTQSADLGMGLSLWITVLVSPITSVVQSQEKCIKEKKKPWPW